MQEVLVAHPRLRLAADLALLAVAPARRHQRAGLPEVLGEVLGDEAALGDDDGRCGGVGGLDGDDGGLAERVDGLERGRRERGLRVAVQDFDGVRDGELGQQPEDALGAGLLEPAGEGLGRGFRGGGGGGYQ